MANTHSIDLEFSSSQYLSITDGNQTGLDIVGDLTLETWIKLESSAHYGIIAKNQGSSKAYRLDFTGAVLTIYLVNSVGTQTSASATWSPSTGIWYHIALTYNASAGEVIFYIDGSQLGNVKTGLVTNIRNSTAPFMIGRPDAEYNGQYFDGLIDDVRVWDDIRTPTEISDNYQQQLVGNEANLVGYWKLNNNLLDETTNNNDLTNNNAAVFSANVPFIDITDYNMPCLVGSFLLTGKDVVLTSARKIIAAVGNFILTGKDVVLTSARKIIAAVGNFILTGKDVLFIKGKGIALEVGNFVLTGKDTALTSIRSMIASVGSFVLTGKDIAFQYGKILIASVGKFILSGKDIKFDRGLRNKSKNSTIFTNKE